MASAGQEKSATISKIIFHPLEKNKLLIEANNLIYVLDIDKLKVEEIKLQISNEKNQINKLSNWLTKNSDIYYIIKKTGQISEKSDKTDQKQSKESYQLLSYNLIAKTGINLGTLEISGLKEIKILNNGGKILIIDNSNNLYIFDITNKN